MNMLEFALTIIVTTAITFIAMHLLALWGEPRSLWFMQLIGVM